MYSPAAFPASRSVMPGSDEARKMTATSGRTCSAVLTKSSQIGLLLKTLLESSRWSSKARFLRWQVQPTYSIRSTIFEDTDCARPLPCNASATTLKVTDIPSSRCLFRLVPLEPRTDATGSSSSDTEMQTFLKTPCAADSWSDGMESKGVSGTSGTLAQEVVSGYAEKHRGLLLPTPLVVEREHPERVEALKATGATRINSRANGEQRPNGLIDFMQFYDMLPTPTCNDAINQSLPPSQAKRNDSIVKRILTGDIPSAMLPTPRANKVNGCDLNNPKIAERNHANLEEEVAKMVISQDVDAGKGFRLSPLFTEEMMGFPLMWTTLPFLSANGAPNPSKPTETPSSRK